MKINFGKKAITVLAITTIAATLTACGSEPDPDTTTTETGTEAGTTTVADDDMADDDMADDNMTDDMENTSTEATTFNNVATGITVEVPSTMMIEDRSDDASEDGLYLQMEAKDYEGSLHVVSQTNATQADIDAIMELREKNISDGGGSNITYGEEATYTISGLEFVSVPLTYTKTSDGSERSQNLYYYMDPETSNLYVVIETWSTAEEEALDAYNEVIDTIVIAQ